MKQKKGTSRLRLRKNPGRKARAEREAETRILRGERIPGTRVIPDKRNTRKEERMKKEIKEE